VYSLLLYVLDSLFSTVYVLLCFANENVICSVYYTDQHSIMSMSKWRNVNIYLLLLSLNK